MYASQRPGWLDTAVALLVLVSARTANAQPTAEARQAAAEHFDRGLALVNEHRNEEALRAFEEAYALTREPMVLLNIGLVNAELGNALAALDNLEKLQATGARLGPEQATRVRDEIERQRRRVARLMVDTNAPASLTIDGIKAGTTPRTRPVYLQPGQHTVSLSATGFVPVTRSLTLAAGVETRLWLPLTTLPAPPAPIVPTFVTAGPSVAGDERRDRQRRVLGWVLTSSGAVTAAVGAALLYGDWQDRARALAHRQNLVASLAVPGAPCDRRGPMIEACTKAFDAANAWVQGTERAALRSLGITAIGLGTGAVGLVYLLGTQRPEEPRATASGVARQAQVRLWTTIDTRGGILVHGRY